MANTLQKTNVSVPVSITALYVAAERYKETIRPDNVLNGILFEQSVTYLNLDPLAGKLAGEEGFAFQRLLETRFPSHRASHRTFGIRARFIDDFVTDKIKNHNIK